MIQLACSMLLVIACATGQERGAARSAQPGREVELTSEQAALDVQPTLRASGPLQVSIVHLANPTKLPFMLHVSVVSTQGGAARTTFVGAITPFPADQPGKFLLELPDTARAAIAQPGAKLHLALEPIAPNRPLPADLRLTVALAR